MAEKTLREKCEIRLSSMSDVRGPYEQDWQEIFQHTLPSRGIVQIGQGGAKSASAPTRRANKANRDSKGGRAARTLTNGLQTGMNNQAIPWFKLQTPDPDLMEFEPVKVWLAEVERRLYDLFASTNFYDASKTGYSELGTIGVEACVMLEHRDYRAVCHSLTAGEYWIATDEGLRVDTLYRRSYLTTTQMVGSFPWDRLSQHVRDHYDKGNYQVMFPVIHAIEPRRERNPDKFDGANKPWASITWEEGNTDKSAILRESGYDTKPFWAPRWETTSAEVYSASSPGFYALPDLREMQLGQRNRGRATDLIVKPPMKAPVGMAGNKLRLDPGSITFGTAMDLDKVGSMFDIGYQSLQAIREEHEAKRRDVEECFFSDLFMAISQREGVQPLNDLETSLRENEKYTQIGPVVDRINIEKLEVAIDRGTSILHSLGQMPPAPQELQGKALTTNFISPLAQAQRAGQNSAIERAARFVGFVAGIFPDAAIKFDAEQAIDEFATGTGTPPKIIRSDEIVAQMKQQMQQQQQMEQMAQMAPAAQQGAQAAELLSRTNVGGGQSMLDQMVGAA
ncbi:MAG TPA: portal protein [Sphingomonas sp.]|jgi:hypothetical protein